MRHRIGQQLQVTNREALAIAAEMQLHAVALVVHRLVSTVGEPDRQLMPPGELEYAAYMVLVFVGNNDAGKVGREHLQSGQTSFGFLDGEAAIQHQRGTRAAGLGGNE
ncbi:hypothetical protein D3C81_1829350 [compost metagenome]